MKLFNYFIYFYTTNMNSGIISINIYRHIPQTNR